MEKSKALIFDVLVDVVLKNGETVVGFINKKGMQSEVERDFIKVANKRITKGVRSTEKRFKATQVATISASEAKSPNF